MPDPAAITPSPGRTNPAAAHRATCPPIRQRGWVRGTPWQGLTRRLSGALRRRRPSPPPHDPARADRPVPAAAPPAWARAARRRRGALGVTALGLAVLAASLHLAEAPASPGPGFWLYGALLVLLFAWVGVGLVTAALGAWVLWRGDPHALRLPPRWAPLSRQARTAVVMPICNEDVATVFAGLRATCESVASTGALALFDFYILSDTQDAALRAAELRAWARLREMLGDRPVGDGGRVFYRWRRHRTKRKAGNVADFCRRWGADYRYMVVLDADSAMQGDTLVQLVRLMEAHPRAGILQTLPQPCGHGTLHARVQQFAHRVTGRLFSLGMAYWQLGDSHYWGHNAILRVAPFMAHCGLPALPGRGGLAGDILSHDFVEAALMARAGHEVWLVPDLGGSWEQNPPHLLDELKRDRRWCQGNLQNARLLAEPGWRPVHRAMLATAAFSYLVAPLWLLFLAVGVATGSRPAPGLWLLTLVLLLLPRLLGVASVLLRREGAHFGGSRALLVGAAIEAVLSALLAPVRLLAHTRFVLGALTGWPLAWQSPARQALGVAWRDAWAQLGRWALPLLLVFGLALGSAAVWQPAWWPVLLPWALATPLAVLGGSPRLAAWLRRTGWLAAPDDRQPPTALRRAQDTRGFDDLLGTEPLQARRPSPAPARGARLAWARPAAALGAVAVLTWPLAIQSPELSDEVRHEQAWAALWAQAPQALIPQVRPQPQAATVVYRPGRPARHIDDAIRSRARQAVARALASEAAPLDGPTPPGPST